MSVLYYLRPLICIFLMAGDAIEPFHVFTSHINVFGETSTQVAFNGFAIFCFSPFAVTELVV